MEWLFEHGESIVALGGAVLTFTAWNTAQSFGLKNARDALSHFLEIDLPTYKEQVAEQFKVQQSEIASLRAQQDVVMKTLSEELRRIGEKLAHIEGFLTAKRHSALKR